MTITQRRAPITKQMHDLMDTLLVARQKIPKCRGVFQVGLRVPLLRVDECWELDTISDEEDGRVVSHHIPVAFLRVEFDGEAAGIAGGV